MFYRGEVLSPILFSIYVNDFEMDFLTNNNVPVQLLELNVLLMYADDMVIFAESAEELQAMLNTLYSYTTKWNFTVNVEKTKIVIFRNGRKIRSDEKWFLKGDNISIVDKFMYLGMLINYNGKFNDTQTQLSLQGSKVMFSLKSKTNEMYLSAETMLSLFDTYVGSVPNYGCEIWGFHNSKDVEKVQLQYLKTFLGVKKPLNSAAVYCETGRFQLKVVILFKILKFWFKLYLI